MKESVNRFLILAVGVGMTTLELEQLVQELQLSDIVELSERFRKYRQAVRTAAIQPIPFEQQDDIRSVSAEVAKRDIMSLQRESRISQKEFAQRIVAILRNQGVKGLRVMGAKEGLVRWLEGVSTLVEPSILVNAAVTATQREVPPASNQWRLSRG